MRRRELLSLNPLEGVDYAYGTTTEDVQVFVHDTTGQSPYVPWGRVWRIEQLVLTNFTRRVGYVTVAIMPVGMVAGDQVIDVSHIDGEGRSVSNTNLAGNTVYEFTDTLDLYQRGPAGIYLAYSMPIPPRDAITLDLVVYAYGGEQLSMGAHPGRLPPFGRPGGIGVLVSGREMQLGTAGVASLGVYDNNAPPE